MDETREIGDPFERILADYMLRADRGEQVDREELIAAHPEVAQRLRAYFANADLINAMVPPRDIDENQAAYPPVGRAESVFIAAAALPSAEERAAYLDQTCGGDAALRQRVEALLHLQGAGVSAQTAVHVSSVQPGTIIAGRYKLLEAIGEGGMGTVWVAEQTQPVRRKVALKLIKPGMDSKSVLARFEAERQALAVMDHPNIAKVLDGGLTDSGRPFFVMEYVKGVPITDYCETTRLSIPGRLQLFVQVCQAVQHAHQKGIIHRDLKPSNILIAPYDDRPVPKVIDFGLAKAMHQPLTELTLHTAHESVLGTPLYMSPEQAQLNNLDVDTRADIYSLGVLLYELLTGTTPLEKKRFKEAVWDEVRRIIREEEPPRPSTRLSSSEMLPSLAASRQMEPARLTQLVRGELDWIVMKSLEKDRRRRYETANGFAMDVERYLADEPVEACPPSTGYRIKKFLRRNKGPVLAASIVLFTLIAGIAGTTFGLFRANRAAEDERLAKQAATRAAEVAQAKEAEANAVVTFFEEQVFAAARPKGEDGGLGAGVTLRDAVAASVPAIEKGFAHQPLVEARLCHALGVTFYYLGEYDHAREQFDKARILRERELGSDHPDTLASMMLLANSFRALNRQEEALKLCEETLAIQNRVLPKDHPDTLASMVNMANSFAALNRHAEALKLREVTLAIQKRVLPKDHPSTLVSMMNLANSFAVLNRHAEALKLREETLEIQKRVLPKDHPDTLKSMMALANSYYSMNRHAEALKLREETLEIRKRVLPKDHPDTLRSMMTLAISYAALARQEEALELLEEMLAIQKRVLPKDHPDTLASMINLATIFAALNRHAEALKLYEETLAIQRRVLPKDHPATLTTITNLATSYSSMNRQEEAIKLYEEALEIQRRVLPKDHPDTLLTMLILAATRIELHRGSEAVPLLDDLLAKAMATPSVDPGLVQHVFELRMRYFRKIGDPAGCRATAETWEKLTGPTAGNLYHAACYRAITSMLQAKAKAVNAGALAERDADRAMELLQKAAKVGYKDAEHMKSDSDLEPLHGREDFKKLLAELEKK